MSENSYPKFDKQLLEIDHYQKYPVMMPFVGKSYSNSNTKILMVGESHFLHSESAEIIGQEEFDRLKLDWYKRDLRQFEKLRLQIHSIDTRSVVYSAIYGSFSNSFRIFYNINSELRGIFEHEGLGDIPLEHMCFYNYFQRPAFQSGKSINDTEEDNEKAFAVYNEVVQILKPDLVIFVSSKAANTYKYYRNQKCKDFDSSLSHPDFDAVPHPGSSWWNRRSKNYGKHHNGQYRTGREKFQSLLSTTFKTKEIR
jgi:hypothetical protein